MKLLWCSPYCQALKDNVMAVIKSDKALKAEWSKVRRQITPKVGQITNDEQSIETIVSLLLEDTYNI